MTPQNMYIHGVHHWNDIIALMEKILKKEVNFLVDWEPCRIHNLDEKTLEDYSCDDCAYCKEYVSRPGFDDCEDCPIAERYTAGCHGTSWHHFANAVRFNQWKDALRYAVMMRDDVLRCRPEGVEKIPVF